MATLSISVHFHFPPVPPPLVTLCIQGAAGSGVVMRSVNQAGLSRRIVGFVFFGTAILVSIRPLAEAAHWPDALGGALWAAAVVAVQLLFLYRPVPDGLRGVP